ncbi:MAG: CHAT domain-containing protein [Planctomycetes bacterium]|nr:CHAT domain-containing protein [Planctomycetota bacterium]
MAAQAFIEQGDALVKLNKTDEAVVQYKKGLAIFENASDALGAAEMFAKIGDAYQPAHRIPEAVAGFEENLRRLRAGLGNVDEPRIQYALLSLGACWQEAGEYARAVPYYEDGLMMKRRLIKGDDLEVANTLNNYAFCLNSLGKNAEAVNKCEEALAIRRRVIKEDDGYVASLLFDDACYLTSLNRQAEALLKHEECLAIRRRLFTSDHDDIAECLLRIASCLAVQGKFNEALPRAEEALAMRRRLFKGDHASLSDALGDNAYYLDNLGRSAEALAIHEESLAMRLRLYKGDHTETAAELDTFAFCLMNLGRYAEALQKLKEAHAMNTRLFQGDSLGVVINLANQAQMLNKLEHSSDALAKSDQALAMARRMFKGDHDTIAKLLATAGECLTSLGRDLEATFNYDISLKMYRRLYAGDQVFEAEVLEKLAWSLHFTGQRDLGFVKFKESLAMYRRLFNGDHPAIATLLRKMPLFYEPYEHGRDKDALSNCEEALAMYRRLYKEPNPLLASCLRDVGYFLSKLDMNSEALHKLEEALAMERSLKKGDHPVLVDELLDIADILVKLKRNADALARGDEALAMGNRFAQTSSEYHTSQMLSRLARYLNANGRREDALKTLRTAEKNLRRLGDSKGLEYTMVGESLLDIGGREFAGQALLLLTKSVDIKENSNPDSANISVQGQMLYKERRLGTPDTERKLQKACFLANEPIQQFGFLERARAGTSLNIITQSTRNTLLSARAAAVARHDEPLTKEIDTLPAKISALQSKISQLVTLRDRIPSRQDHDDEGRKQEMSRLAEELGITCRASNDAIQRRAQIIREYARLAADANLYKLVASARAEEVQATLQTDELVLAYNFSYKESYCIFVPPAGGAILAFELHWKDGAIVTGPDLKSLVSAYITLIKEAAREKREAPSDLAVATNRGLPEGTPPRAIPGKASDRGAALFEGLIPEEIWKEIKNCKRVYVVPDGPLHLLPMESLITKRADKLADCEYWLDSGPPIVYVPSGSVLKVLKERHDAQKKELLPFDMLAMGDPVLPKAAASRPTESMPASAPAGAASRPTREFLYKLDPLPGSKREIETIERSLASTRKVKTLLGENATKTEVAKFGPQARVLHFATHHIPYATDSVNLSTLILSPARDGSDEGLLTMADLVDPWRGTLPNCELVVLAGCSTGKGEYLNNEGMYAIPMGFFFAGAPAVVSTLWPVDDASTADFMADFYKQWLSPKDINNNPPSKIDAFTAARKLLKKAHPEPYFWAPFIMMGDPR